jgi:hypothetical protein
MSEFIETTVRFGELEGLFPRDKVETESRSCRNGQHDEQQQETCPTHGAVIPFP